jgi:hypothetical protein
VSRDLPSLSRRILPTKTLPLVRFEKEVCDGKRGGRKNLVTGPMARHATGKSKSPRPGQYLDILSP